MTKQIELQKVSFSHGKLEVLDQIDACFLSGNLSVILGRNGSGKSTLFNIITGLEKRYSGQVLLDGISRKNSETVKRKTLRIGFMNQFHQTTFPYSVFDVVLTGRSSFFKFSPSQKDFEMVEQTLKRFDLWSFKDQTYTSLSGGERQLVLLCRVLVQQPDVLMLDEPTNHLDLNFQVKVMECVRELADSGTMVICVMHDPNLAMMYGDAFYVMENKKLIHVTDFSNQQLKERFEETYKLELDLLVHQGKPVFLPNKKM